ncbi:MAG: hypothetical protein DRP46_05525 [Candidatus Zixiibacteriota bacterium]|nr:MAG: hypothetical protein DRP46_05525 [candidate division Zixibacteria bacterium]HDL03485.1 DUF1573 domain-containing protein [candidate division Zixibacteria bacterium]
MIFYGDFMKGKSPLSVIIMIIFMAVILSYFFGGSKITAQNIPDKPVVSDKGGQAGDSTGIPMIYFPETSFDFGTIKQGEKVTHTYIVKNNGDGPLKLIKAKGS